MKLISIPVIGCMVLLTGCQQAEEFTSVNEKLRMSIEASVGKDGKVSGRSAMDDDGKMSFQDKDSIGLSVNNGNFTRWTYESSTWKQNPETVYWKDKTSEHTFYAFYPYVQDATTTAVPMPDLSKQTGEKRELGKYDFLAATKTQSYGTDGKVSFSEEYAFKHKLSLITITLKGEGDLVSSTISKISLKGTDIVTPYAYSFEDSATEAASDEAESVNELAVSMSDFQLTTKGHTFYFILNPGTVTLRNVSLAIEYTKEETQYVATLEGMGQTSDSEAKFEQGKQYNYSLKVAGDNISISGNEIKDWETGFTIDDIIINKEENQTSPEP